MRTITVLHVLINLTVWVVAKAETNNAFQVEVSFPSKDGLILEGTLRLAAASNDGSPTPGLVLIPGSGPNSRDGFLAGQLGMSFGFSIPVFAEIGNALQQQGINVLTYDKRTCGSFNGCSTNNSYPIPSQDILMDDFFEDALAAVEFLQGRDEVNADGVVVAGHSQGAVFVPILLQAIPSLSGAMLAGAFKPIDELLEYQLDYTFAQLQAAGINRSQALQNPGIQQLSDQVEGVQEIRSGSDEAAGGVPAAFWRSWFNATDNAIVAAATNPQQMLILNGELDTNVPPSEAQAWASYLDSVETSYQLEILPCITHALNCLFQSDFTKITQADVGMNVNTSVIEALAKFVKTVPPTEAPTAEAPPTEAPTVEPGESNPSVAHKLLEPWTISTALMLLLASAQL